MNTQMNQIKSQTRTDDMLRAAASARVAHNLPTRSSWFSRMRGRFATSSMPSAKTTATPTTAVATEIDARPA